jgi:hypothetical protein
LAETMREARNEDLHVLIVGTSMTFETPTRLYDCTLVDVRASCHETDRPPALPESEVLRIAVDTHAYGVSNRPDRTIAGERTRCYLILPTGPGTLPDLGTESEVCLADDGVALAERVLRDTGNTDERQATAVERGVSSERIRALVRSFDPSAADASR